MSIICNAIYTTTIPLRKPTGKLLFQYLLENLTLYRFECLHQKIQSLFIFSFECGKDKCLLEKDHARDILRLQHVDVP